jgi:hypothetical protein
MDNASEILICDLKIPYRLTQPLHWRGFPRPLEATYSDDDDDNIIIIIIIIIKVKFSLSLAN